jgi:hypothetical protein
METTEAEVWLEGDALFTALHLTKPQAGDLVIINPNDAGSAELRRTWAAKGTVCQIIAVSADTELCRIRAVGDDDTRDLACLTKRFLKWRRPKK